MYLTRTAMMDYNVLTKGVHKKLDFLTVFSLWSKSPKAPTQFLYVTGSIWITAQDNKPERHVPHWILLPQFSFPNSSWAVLKRLVVNVRGHWSDQNKCGTERHHAQPLEFSILKWEYRWASIECERCVWRRNAVSRKVFLCTRWKMKNTFQHVLISLASTGC